MNKTAELFYSIGEPFAAGLFEEPEKDYFYRHALALARYYEHLPPAKYESGELNIKASVIVALKKIYNCTYDDFFQGLDQ